MDPRSPVLVGIDAGATKSVAIAVAADGTRRDRAVGPGASPKRQGPEVAADRIASLARRVAQARDPDLLFVAGAGIDRPDHARTLERALRERLPATLVTVANDTLAVLRAATPDAVGLAVPVSTGGNVIGRAADGRVTDRGHGIFGGGYVLGALAARAARRGAPPLGDALNRAVTEAAATLDWRSPRRPGPDAALLGAAVARAAEAGDPYPARMVDRWCAHVRQAVGEEVERLDLGDTPAVIVYGGLMGASPWLGARIRAAVVAASPGARLVILASEPAQGAALLALDAWRGAPVEWAFSPRR